MGLVSDRETKPQPAVKTVGGVLARGLVHRLAARNEPMPVQHALAIVVSAAAKVHNAHIAGGRLIATLETVLIRFDGTVEIEAPTGTADVGGIPRSDVVALGALLAELVREAPIPAGLAEAFTNTIDVEQGPGSAGELARALAFAAKAAGIKLSRGELGKWARRQVHPPRLAHTLRRDSVPELGVDLGAVKPKPKEKPKGIGKLAKGSGTFPDPTLDDPDETDSGEIDFELDVDVDDLIEEVTTPALAVVSLPLALQQKIAAGQQVPAPKLPLPAHPPMAAPRSWGPALVALLAVLVILGAAGIVLFYR